MAGGFTTMKNCNHIEFNIKINFEIFVSLPASSSSSSSRGTLRHRPSAFSPVFSKRHAESFVLKASAVAASTAALYSSSSGCSTSNFYFMARIANSDVPCQANKSMPVFHKIEIRTNVFLVRGDQQAIRHNMSLCRD